MPLLLSIYLCLCSSVRLTPRHAALTDGNCTLYYIVNADGMKGLGHSILVLTDEKGCGIVLSFSGMQRSLRESFAMRSGVGKMSIAAMDAEATAAFLRTGDLRLDGDQLDDNYDWALYRQITESEYEAVLEAAAPYVATQVEFENLYTKWAFAEDAGRKKAYWEQMEQMGRDDSLPLYQIYTHNCDDAARELASAVDDTMREYCLYTWCITPNGNIKAFAHAADGWGVAELGENGWPERTLLFLIVF